MRRTNNPSETTHIYVILEDTSIPMKLSSNINNLILARKHSNVIFEPRGDDNVENK